MTTPERRIFELPLPLIKKVRLLAAEVALRKGSVRAREISRRASRLAEEALQAGAPRWEAMKLEDDFKQAVYCRIAQMTKLPEGAEINRNVVPFLPREGAAA